MQVGDVVFARGNTFTITGIYLGIAGAQNLIGLKSETLCDGDAHGCRIDEMLVPEELVIMAGVYRKVT